MNESEKEHRRGISRDGLIVGRVIVVMVMTALAFPASSGGWVAPGLAAVIALLFVIFFILPMEAQAMLDRIQGRKKKLTEITR